MHVGMVARHFSLKSVGAVQRCVYELARRLKREGERCTIYTNGAEQESYTVDGIDVVQLASPHFSEQAAKMTEDVDVCHFHGSTAGCVQFLRHSQRKPVLTIYDVQPRLGELLNLRPSHLLEGRILNVPSYWLLAAPKRWLAAFFASHASAITGTDISWLSTSLPFVDVGMGVDMKAHSFVEAARRDVRERLEIAPEQKVVLYLGHGYLIRGLDVLIRAHAALSQQEEDAVLVLVLNPYELNERVCTLAMRTLPERNLRIIRQFVPDVAAHYAAADVVALPYLYSGELPTYPFVMLEAMACGKPVLTTPVGAIPRLIDGTNGVLVKPASAAELKGAAERVLGDEKMAERMGKRARQSVEQFDWERAHARFHEIYEGVMVSG